MQKIGKTNEPILRKTLNGQTDELTHMKLYDISDETSNLKKNCLDDYELR